MAMDYIWLTDKLKGEYKEAFDKAEIYAQMRNIDEDTMGDMLMELLDIFLTAQEEGRPVEKVIGSDLEKFCASYFSGYTLKSYLKSIPKTLYRCMWWVLALEMIFVLFRISEEDFSIFHSTEDISGYVCGFFVGALIIFLCNTLIRPFMFRWKWLTSNRFSAFALILLLGMIITSGILLDGYELKIPIFLSLFVPGIYVLIYIIVRSVWRYRKYGSIRKQKISIERKGMKGIKKQLEEELPDTLTKLYHKKNKKLEKKGKEPMTPEEYMQWLRAQNKRTRKQDKIGIAIVLLFVLALIIYNAIVSTWIDTLLFAAALFVVEIPAMLLFRLGDWNTRLREKLIEECERRGITVLEYAEEDDHNAEV